MGIFADRCVRLLGGDTLAPSLTVASGVQLLKRLRDGEGSRSGSPLSAKSVACYYQAFRRMLELNGVTTKAWPNAPTPPRKTREAMTYEDTTRLIGWLDQAGLGISADLVRLLRGTGLRIGVEALSPASLTVVDGPTYTSLMVRGKGGHERAIPVVECEARRILTDSGRLEAIRTRPYHAHLQAIAAGVKALGINSALATPHSLRHTYAVEALRKSGGNISMVQELLGHSDPATTSRYLQTDLTAKAHALAQP